MKKKQKAHRKHHAQNASRNKSSINKKKMPSTSSNWNLSVRAATGSETEITPTEDSSPMARGEFTPGEIGQIAPLDQEGEGNRQNAEAEELEQIKPDDDLTKS